MESNVNYTVVGAFVIILFTAIVIGIIWLSSGFAMVKNQDYLVYMTESVSGLSQDSPVEYNGVNVGNVKTITINHKNPRVVDLVLSIDSETPITRGTRATLNTRGFTGVTFIALKDQGTDRTPLRAERGQPYPIISTAPSLFMRLDTALNNITQNFQKISQAIQSLLDQENLHTIKKTMVNIENITKTLSDQSVEMSHIMKNTAKMTDEFIPVVRSTGNTVQLIQTQTIPAANEAIYNLNSIMNNLSEASASIKQNPAVIIRGRAPRQLGPGEK